MSLSEELRARVIDSLVSFGAERELIADDTTLETLDIDSLDVAELAEMLREECDIAIDVKDFAECQTVGDAFAVIAERAGGS